MLQLATDSHAIQQRKKTASFTALMGRLIAAAGCQRLQLYGCCVPIN